MLSIIAISLCIGAVVGFLAGLLGIGGGLIVVPALVMLLPAFGIVPAEQAIVVAIATSLASIIITASSSVRAHHRWGNVPWSVAGAIMTGAALGAWSVGYLAHHISGPLLQMIFGVAVLLEPMPLERWIGFALVWHIWWLVAVLRAESGKG